MWLLVTVSTNRLGLFLYAGMVFGVNSAYEIAAAWNAKMEELEVDVEIDVQRTGVNY